MELDLISLFGLLCTAVLIGWNPRTPAPPPHLGSYTRALLVSQDRRQDFVTPDKVRLHTGDIGDLSSTPHWFSLLLSPPYGVGAQNNDWYRGTTSYFSPIAYRESSHLGARALLGTLWYGLAISVDYLCWGEGLFYFKLFLHLPSLRLYEREEGSAICGLGLKRTNILTWCPPIWAPWWGPGTCAPLWEAARGGYPEKRGFSCRPWD